MQRDIMRNLVRCGSRAFSGVSTCWIAFWIVMPLIGGTDGVAPLARRIASRVAVASDSTILRLAAVNIGVFALLWIWRWSVELTDSFLPRWPWEENAQ